MKISHYSENLQTKREDQKLTRIMLSFTSYQTELRYKNYLETANKNTNLKHSCEINLLFNICILVVYLISYITEKSDENNNHSTTMKVILAAINIAIISILLGLMICLKTLNIYILWISKISYVFSSIILILNDYSFQSIFFSEIYTGHFSCIPGLFFFGILFLNILTYQEFFLCNIVIGFLFVVPRLYKYNNDIAAYECTLLILLLIYQIVYKYIEEYSIKQNFLQENNDESDAKEQGIPLKETSESQNSINHCIQELSKILPELKNKTKNIVENVITSLQAISIEVTQQSTFSILEKLTVNLDEEDKIYIEQSCLPPQIEKLQKQKRFMARTSIDKIIEKALNHDAILILKQVSNNWNIDTFEFDLKTERNALTLIGGYCLKLYNLIDVYSIASLKAGYFFNGLQNNYKNNPYHNAVHGADVLVSGLFLISNSEISTHLSSLEMLIVIISHIGHDVSHPGVTNRFLINTQHELALRCNFYIDNDISVLENMHSCLIFSMLQETDKNILENLKKNEFLLLRK